MAQEVHYPQGDAALGIELGADHPIRYTENQTVADQIRTGIRAGSAVSKVEGLFLVYLDGPRYSVESLSPNLTGNFQAPNETV